MHVTIKKWGNSASIRIPAAILEAARLGVEATVDIREEGGRIVIEPLRPSPDDLAAAYQAMAADDEREREALEWSNALIGDAADAPR